MSLARRLSMPYLRRLVATIIVINLFAVSLAGLSSYHGYRQYRERAEVSAQNLVYALESNLVNIIRRIDVSLLALLDRLAEQPGKGPRDIVRLNQQFDQVRQRLPEVAALRMTDAQGMLLLGDGLAPGDKISLADRPHFIRLRDEAGAGLVISHPQISRVGGQWVIVLARRVARSDGHFDGMLFAVLELEQLTQEFSALDLGSDGAVSLRDEALGMVARYPDLATVGLSVGQKYVPPELKALFDAGKTKGTFFTRADAGNRESTLSFRKLGDYPLYATVELASSDYLAVWRDDNVKLMAVLALFLLGSVYVGRIQYRSWQRQQQANEVIIRQEALYHELVEDTPMLVVRYLGDSTITFANKAYAAFFGMSSEQLRGRRWLDFIPNAEERVATQAVLAALTPALPLRSSSLYQMLGKDGQTHWTQWTDHAIFDAQGGLQYLQSVGEDITERKRVRDIQEARLRLMEFAAEHTMHELLVATLDEAGVLTESPIGFYHFLEPDQLTLALQAWSTRTSQEYCKAEGEGRHYNINEAGVWVEAIRERRSIIHNDYAALPNKHGLPPGHAVVLREMVVPVFRKGAIVAILGVGNKATLYTDYDLQTVSQLADQAWDIAEAKRLEAELLEMASTDYLTGLHNRRSFMHRMQEELERLKRFDIPRAAVLMLDLDFFKRVNDSYGHAAGDAVLKHFSGLMQAALRKIDSGGRVGGEEFAILLLGADLAAAEQFAERLRSELAASPTEFETQTIAVTVSIGIAMMEAGDSKAEIALSRADAALYDAKHSGRDRVCVRQT